MMIWKMIQNLVFVHSVTSVWIEDILYCPWQGPVYVPLLILLALYPASFFKILDKSCFIQISFPSELGYAIILLHLFFLLFIIFFEFFSLL